MMLKRLSAWFWSVWSKPMSVIQLAKHFEQDAMLLMREENTRDQVTTEEWLIRGLTVHLVQDYGLHPGCMIQIDGGEWEKAWSVEADASLAGMLREACYFIAELPSE